MKKDIFIEFDEKPNSINPLMFSDFNSKILNSLMFERLVDGKNCKIDIFNNYREYKVSFYDSLLSNHIYPIDYLRTILYQLKNNSYVYGYFSKKAINSLKYEFNKEYFKLKFLFPVLFFDIVLQSSYIVNSSKINLYKYILDKFNINNHLVNIIYNRDKNKTLDYIYNGENFISCFSEPNINLLTSFKAKKTIFEKDSSLIFYIFSKKRCFIDLLYSNKIFLNNELNKIKHNKFISVVNSFIPIKKDIFFDLKREVCDSNVKINLDKCITLCYCDFLPNKEIVDVVIKLLKLYGISVLTVKYDSLSEYLKYRNNYDMHLGISSPRFNSYYFFIFDLFNNLEKSKQDYVKKIFLNNLNDVKKFSTAFSHTKNFLPICRLKFIYYNNTILNINEFGDFYAY